jgi:Ca2+/H+ antiporter, TMEM165/GDT1 family
MNPLIPAFVAVLLSELGGTTQWLAVRDRNGLRFLILIGTLALATMVIAGFVGNLVARSINTQAITLMLGVSLLVTGVMMLITPAKPGQDKYAIFILIKTQAASYGSFIVFALSAYTLQPLLAAIGGVIGVLAATVPMILLGRGHPALQWLKLARQISGGLLAVTGFWTAIHAL